MGGVMNVTGTNASVTGTRNSRKPLQFRFVTGVTGVPTLCARVRDAHIHARTHINNYSPRVHTRNTGNTGYNIDSATVSDVTGIGNIEIHTRNSLAPIKVLTIRKAQMTVFISRHCIEMANAGKIMTEWHASAIGGKLYLMAEILESMFGVDSESKDAQRLAPVIARALVALGMTNKRLRGPSGNRHYWVK